MARLSSEHSALLGVSQLSRGGRVGGSVALAQARRQSAAKSP